jgi:L-idonate 5-dehydrogenase
MMMKIQTQSCVVNGKYDVAVVEQEVEYQGHGTLVKITRGGICGSDLHYYQEGKVGSFQVRQPMVLGHEVIGEVVASDTARLPVGQKVALNPSKPCGQCKYCLADQQNQCTQMRFFGSAMYFPHVDGAFTQYKVVDSAQCIAFDANCDEKVMVFAEPLAVAIHAARQPGEVKGKKVFVSGVGPIGCLLVAALKALGATKLSVPISARVAWISPERWGHPAVCTPAMTISAAISRKKGTLISLLKSPAIHCRCSVVWRSPAPRGRWCKSVWEAASRISR